MLSSNVTVTQQNFGWKFSLGEVANPRVSFHFPDPTPIPKTQLGILGERMVWADLLEKRRVRSIKAHVSGLG